MTLHSGYPFCTLFILECRFMFLFIYIYIFPSLSFEERCIASLEADSTFFVYNNPEFTANGLVQKTKSYITDTAGSRTNTHALQ